MKVQRLCGWELVCERCRGVSVGEPNETDAKEAPYGRRAHNTQGDEMEQGPKILFGCSTHRRPPIASSREMPWVYVC